MFMRFIFAYYPLLYRSFIDICLYAGNFNSIRSVGDGRCSHSPHGNAIARLRDFQMTVMSPQIPTNLPINVNFILETKF